MLCPFCNKQFVIPEVAIINTESYGGSGHNLKCNKCGGVARVCMYRTVNIDSIRKTDLKEDDWGE